MTISVSFPSSHIVFISPLFLKDIFCWVSNSWLTVFFFLLGLENILPFLSSVFGF